MTARDRIRMANNVMKYGKLVYTMCNGLIKVYTLNDGTYHIIGRMAERWK